MSVVRTRSPMSVYMKFLKKRTNEWVSELVTPDV